MHLRGKKKNNYLRSGDRLYLWIFFPFFSFSVTWLNHSLTLPSLPDLSPIQSNSSFLPFNNTLILSLSIFLLLSNWKIGTFDQVTPVLGLMHVSLSVTQGTPLFNTQPMCFNEVGSHTAYLTWPSILLPKGFSSLSSPPWQHHYFLCHVLNQTVKLQAELIRYFQANTSVSWESYGTN